MIIPFPVRVGFLVLICMLFIGGYLLLKLPVPQDQIYYNFADQRSMLGVKHMLNVASNLPFLVFSAYFVLFMLQRRHAIPSN